MDLITTRRIILAGATAAVAALAGCNSPLGQSETETETRTEERTLPLNGVEQFNLTNDVGEVTVEGADRDDVYVRIEKEATSDTFDDLQVNVVRDDRVLHLIGEIADSNSINQDASARSIDLTVEVPQSLTVSQVECSVGKVVVRDTMGDLRVEVSTGAIDVVNIDGYVDVRGDVDDVTVHSVAGVDRVTAGVGKIDVEMPAIRRNAQIETNTGEIIAALAPDLDATVEAETDTGEISVTDLPLSVSQGSTGASASGALGGNTHTLTVETEIGEITLEQL